MSAWYAIDDSTRENGCLRAIPGTHQDGIRIHGKSDTSGNLLSINQEVPVDSGNGSKRLRFLIAHLKPKASGEMNLFMIVIAAAFMLAAQNVRCEPEPWNEAPEGAGGFAGDWLVHDVDVEAGVWRGEHSDELVMANGLIRRVFRLAPNAATVAFDNLMTGESILRGVKPEATLTLDGETIAVGGLLGQEEYAYLRPEWIDSMTSDTGAFQFAGYEIGETQERFAWKRVRYAANETWPPPGVALRLDFKAPEGKFAGIEVSIHFEMYDGLPLLCKWFELRNGTGRAIELDAFVSEILACVEPETQEYDLAQWAYPNLHVESDYAFYATSPRLARRVTTRWSPDPQYTTHAGKYLPALLESKPPFGPDQILKPGESFESFRTFELVHDGEDQERRGLATRRMYRVIAPWSTENPILMHVRNSDSASVKLAIDQCAEVGFEMVIMTFWSGFDMENLEPDYLAEIKGLVDYAHERDIELGGYSLLASRSAGPEHDVILPDKKTLLGATPEEDAIRKVFSRVIWGAQPCLESEWGRDYFRKISSFVKKTGIDLIEHDGNYPGNICASSDHSGHRGLGDSQWNQWKKITDFYKDCRARGVYLNVPDWYFLSGSNKIHMNYKEGNNSLPRERQVLLNRQNIYDGTKFKTQSMGWMFLPLVEYQGGGEAATLEPLSEHLDVYEAQLAQNFGSGVQACYRGPRLYDTDETKVVVKKWVDFYKRNRAILDSDVIHVRRPDGRDIDAILHVNPRLEIKGLAMVYNPLDRAVERTLELPLYYTGLSETARIGEKDGPKKTFKLDREYNVALPIKMKPRSFTWFVVE